MPQDALYCADCGARAVDFTVAQSDFSPSHFNSGVTATSQPHTTVPTEEATPQTTPPPPSAPDERGRSSGRRGFALLVITVLAILLVGVTFETGMLSSGVDTSPLNSPATPLTGEQLYSAYSTNQSQAEATYANRTLYIQDTLDFGVGHDFGTGQFYSSVDRGSVVLIWSDPAQVNQLYAGAVVLAKCSVEGLQASQASGAALYLQGCNVISVQSPTAVSAPGAPVANL